MYIHAHVHSLKDILRMFVTLSFNFWLNYQVDQVIQVANLNYGLADLFFQTKKTLLSSKM